MIMIMIIIMFVLITLMLIDMFYWRGKYKMLTNVLPLTFQLILIIDFFLQEKIIFAVLMIVCFTLHLLLTIRKMKVKG